MSIKNLIQSLLNKFGYKITRLSSHTGSVLDRNSIELLVKSYGPDIVYHMAATGEGTNECMDKGCLPVLTHFHQPIPDLKDLERRGVWDKVSGLKGIEWNLSKFMDNLRQILVYAKECNFHLTETNDSTEFFIKNNAFGYCDAVILYSIIRKNKPKNLIEVGSGMSSRVIASALRANYVEGSYTEYTIIDPYCQIDLNLYPKGTMLLKQQVETTDISLFTKLKENDILFIDSSHVCKIGSDVNFEILEVLPVLNKGVYVHFHDIVMPYEYPKSFATNPEFRMFWTEDYLLQAFLAFNRKYEVIFPSCHVLRTHANEASKLFPPDIDNSSCGGASLWIKCVEGDE